MDKLGLRTVIDASGTLKSPRRQPHDPEVLASLKGRRRAEAPVLTDVDRGSTMTSADTGPYSRLMIPTRGRS